MAVDRAFRFNPPEISYRPLTPNWNSLFNRTNPVPRSNARSPTFDDHILHQTPLLSVQLPIKPIEDSRVILVNDSRQGAFEIKHSEPKVKIWPRMDSRLFDIRRGFVPGFVSGFRSFLKCERKGRIDNGSSRARLFDETDVSHWIELTSDPDSLIMRSALEMRRVLIRQLRKAIQNGRHEMCRWRFPLTSQTRARPCSDW